MANRQASATFCCDGIGILWGGDAPDATRTRGSAAPEELSFPPDARLMWAIDWHGIMVVYVLRSARQCDLPHWWLLRADLSEARCGPQKAPLGSTNCRKVVTGSNERPVDCGVPDPWCSYWITAAGLLGRKSLVDGRNAAKGSRQTGCAPSEDAVAPEARPSRPRSGAVRPPGRSPHGMSPDVRGDRTPAVMRRPPGGGGTVGVLCTRAHRPRVHTVAHMELMPCRGI